MNTLIKNQYPLFQYYQSLRGQMMEMLVDEDLSFALPGNPSLGKLCVEIGEVQTSYIQSFKTFKQDFSYRVDNPGLTQSVNELKTWYTGLDSELLQALSDLTETELAEKKIDRGHDFQVLPQIQLEIYKEALLIFYGKSSVYLKALGKKLTEQWVDWIA